MSPKKTVALHYTQDNRSMKIVDAISKSIRGVGKPVIVSKMIDKMCSDPDLLLSVIVELIDKGEAQAIHKSIVKQFKIHSANALQQKVVQQSLERNASEYVVSLPNTNEGVKVSDENTPEAEDKGDATEGIQKKPSIELNLDPSQASDIFKSSGTKITRKGRK